jgi:selenocysteine lyase/cysteine desulfurase
MHNIDWQAWRGEFPGLQQATYLNTVSLGQLSRRSRSAVNRFLDLWTAKGASAWYQYWLNEIEALRREFAVLIGAYPDEIALLPNVSAGLAAISSSMDFSKRNKVVAAALDFPTLTHHWLAKSREGITLDILPSPDNITVPLDAYEKAVDKKTALIATSRVFFTTGFIQDVAALAEIAHRKGAYLLVDDYQGTGQIPIDVKKTGVDMLITGGLKWLMGGPGIAYMYVRRDLIPTLEPTVAGWFGAANQFDFDPHAFTPRSDARRFEAGTPATAAVYAAKPGLEIVNEIGSDTLRARSMALTGDLMAKLQERGYRLRTPPTPDQQASIIIVEAENPAEIVRRLADRRIIVDKRPGAVRVSPYFYNTLEENDVFVQALDEVVGA